MNDGSVLILFLLVALVLLWFFVWGPHAKEARAERKHREAEERARREAERSKLEAECEALLESIRPRVPDFILKSHLEFEREYRSKGGEGIFGQEMPPLVCVLLIFCDFASFTRHLKEVTSHQMGPTAGRCPAPPLFNSSGARLLLSQRYLVRRSLPTRKTHLLGSHMRSGGT